MSVLEDMFGTAEDAVPAPPWTSAWKPNPPGLAPTLLIAPPIWRYYERTETRLTKDVVARIGSFLAAPYASYVLPIIAKQLRSVQFEGGFWRQMQKARGLLEYIHEHGEEVVKAKMRARQSGKSRLAIAIANAHVLVRSILVGLPMVKVILVTEGREPPKRMDAGVQWIRPLVNQTTKLTLDGSSIVIVDQWDGVTIVGKLLPPPLAPNGPPEAIAASKPQPEEDDDDDVPDLVAAQASLD
jgi:hypothetical protein